jgi:hypothetical protein
MIKDLKSAFNDQPASLDNVPGLVSVFPRLVYVTDLVGRPREGSRS